MMITIISSKNGDDDEDAGGGEGQCRRRYNNKVQRQISRQQIGANGCEAYDNSFSRARQIHTEIWMTTAKELIVSGKVESSELMHP